MRLTVVGDGGPKIRSNQRQCSNCQNYGVCFYGMNSLKIMDVLLIETSIRTPRTKSRI
jgi:hypothetical protein